VSSGTKEDTATCTAFFEDLKHRVLADPLLVVAVTDGVTAQFSGAPARVERRALKDSASNPPAADVLHRRPAHLGMRQVMCDQAREHHGIK